MDRDPLHAVWQPCLSCGIAVASCDVDSQDLRHGNDSLNISSAMLNPSRVVVYCDEQADRDLFLRFQEHSKFLAAIPADNLKVLPTTGAIDAHNPHARINVLLSDDRPDYVFVLAGKPVLVVEMTKHGYTGDNSLQRFTRLAIAAEGKCAAIYFTPFSRVRDDELDLGRGSPSKRRVSTEMFRGMSRLAEIFKVPMIALDWAKNEAGLPFSLAAGMTAGQFRKVCGELISSIEVLLRDSAEKLGAGTNTLEDAWVKNKLSDLRKLWEVPNTRPSAVKLTLERQQLRTILQNPAETLKLITKKDYFFKDKPERLLLLNCIQQSRIELIRRGGLPPQPAATEMKRVDDLIKGRDMFESVRFYQTGYKWRSDPHCGVLVNIDYTQCRESNGRTHQDKDCALILFWPRVFLSETSRPYVEAMGALASLSKKDWSADICRLFIERYGNKSVANQKIDQLLRGKGELVVVWRDDTKQARVFRYYCDLIILGDAIIVGDSWGTI